MAELAQSVFSGAVVGMMTLAVAVAALPRLLRALSEYWLNPSNATDEENEVYFNREYARPREDKTARAA